MLVRKSWREPISSTRLYLSKKSACEWSSNPYGWRVNCIINGPDKGKVFTEVLLLSAIRCPSLLPCSLSLLTATRLNILEMWLTNNRNCVTSGCLGPWRSPCNFDPSPGFVSPFYFCHPPFLTTFRASGLPTGPQPLLISALCPLFAPDTSVPTFALSRASLPSRADAGLPDPLYIPGSQFDLDRWLEVLSHLYTPPGSMLQALTRFPHHWFQCCVENSTAPRTLHH